MKEAEMLLNVSEAAELGMKAGIRLAKVVTLEAEVARLRLLLDASAFHEGELTVEVAALRALVDQVADKDAAFEEMGEDWQLRAETALSQPFDATAHQKAAARAWLTEERVNEALYQAGVGVIPIPDVGAALLERLFPEEA